MMMRDRHGAQRSWTLSILLHLAIAGVIGGLWYWAAQRPRPVEPLGIEARVVSSEALNAVPAPDPEPEPEIPPDTPVEEAQPETPPPDPGPTPEQVAAAKAAEEARVAEERRIAVERETAERNKAAAEKAERDRLAKEKAEREKAAKEQAEKEKAERERLAREQAQKERAEQARRQREDELSEQLAAEERRAAARNSTLMAQYRAQIQNAIRRAWIQPPQAVPGIECELRVTQTPTGVVTAARVNRCNGDETVRQSVEAAVYRASPLPLPPDPALFERELVITFRPN